MKFSLIICTYHRPEALKKLLNSVEAQSLYPNEILVIDGSYNSETGDMLKAQSYERLKYFRISAKERGLTRQRNYGIARVSKEMEVVCFLDDDIILKPDYFEKLLNTYEMYLEAVGVGGYIIDEVKWERSGRNEVRFDEFYFDGWKRKSGSRNVLRKRLGLLSNRPPGYMPEEGNGFSTGFLPPSGEIYPVEFFMGGVASYRKELLDKIKFSEYFEGYGLYEDMDFCLRASRAGQLYVNTAAQLYHHHDESGRPNQFKYGKMVIKNGWYVWRVKYPKPGLSARLKWHATAFLLSLVRLGNVINTKDRKAALTESWGRIVGWWSLLLKKPRPNR